MKRAVGRRGLLKALRDPEPPPRRRPPGGVGGAVATEREFLAKCSGCGDCVTACPHDAIFTLAAHVRPGAGTPVMVPDSRACAMCEGFPCAAACPDEALAVPEGTAWRLGVVDILPEHCLPFRGPECGACAGSCPDGVEPGTLRIVRNKPVINQETCVGCGLCLDACIVRPRGVALRPLPGPALRR